MSFLSRLRASTSMWIQEKSKRSPVLASILTLLTGTMISQVVVFFFQIFINRVYTDQDKGLLGVYGTVTTFVIAVAALRFDLTIVLPKSDVAARVLKKLATRAIVVSAMLTSLASIVLANVLIEYYHHSVELSRWLMISGVTVFAIAEITNIQYWLTREAKFGVLASNRVLQSVATAGLQLLFGLLMHGGLSALMIGTLSGQLITLIVLKFRTPELREPLPEDAPRMRDLARRYKDMPLLNGPNVLVDAIRNMGINLLIGAYAIAALGQFQVAWAIMQVPVALVVGSISQVFLKKLSTVERGKMMPLLAYTLKRTALVSALVFGILFFITPWLIPFVFGPQWVLAGQFGQALTPWLFMMVLTSPFSSIFVVTENQKTMLIFAIFYAIVPLSWLVWSPLELLPTIYVLAALMAVMLSIMLVLSFWVARKYDRGTEPVSEEA
ncbi:MAG: polysaccharide biosynthesis protein [Actinomycetaceae bacterium]|nr:polysaccharide biosynthesis protein [Actinomycetaceae bacterium]